MMLWVGFWLLLACAVGGALFPRIGWPLELIVSLLPQICFVTALFAVCMATVGRPGLAILALCAVLLCAWGVREMFAPRDPQIENRDVRVLWANVFGEPEAFRRTMRFASQSGVDVVVIGELPTGLAEAEWRSIAGEYLHHAGRPTMQGVKIAVFSRLPISNVEPIGISWRPNRQGLMMRVATEAGPLAIVGVHPSVPAIPIAQRARDETSRVAFERTRAAGINALLVGDFNTVPWSPLFRDAVADGRLTRARIGVGSTWMSSLPIIGLPIDHAFAANGARISARVGPGNSSDHLPLLIDVELGEQR